MVITEAYLAAKTGELAQSIAGSTYSKFYYIPLSVDKVGLACLPGLGNVDVNYAETSMPFCIHTTLNPKPSTPLAAELKYLLL